MIINKKKGKIMKENQSSKENKNFEMSQSNDSVPQNETLVALQALIKNSSEIFSSKKNSMVFKNSTEYTCGKGCVSVQKNYSFLTIEEKENVNYPGCSKNHEKYNKRMESLRNEYLSPNKKRLKQSLSLCQPPYSNDRNINKVSSSKSLSIDRNKNEYIDSDILNKIEANKMIIRNYQLKPKISPCMLKRWFGKNKNIGTQKAFNNDVTKSTYFGCFSCMNDKEVSCQGVSSESSLECNCGSKVFTKLAGLKLKNHKADEYRNKCNSTTAKRTDFCRQHGGNAKTDQNFWKMNETFFNMCQCNLGNLDPKTPPKKKLSRIFNIGTTKIFHSKQKTLPDNIDRKSMDHYLRCLCRFQKSITQQLFATPCSSDSSQNFERCRCKTPNIPIQSFKQTEEKSCQMEKKPVSSCGATEERQQPDMKNELFKLFSQKCHQFDNFNCCCCNTSCCCNCCQCCSCCVLLPPVEVTKKKTNSTRCKCVQAKQSKVNCGVSCKCTTESRNVETNTTPPPIFHKPRCCCCCKRNCNNQNHCCFNQNFCRCCHCNQSIEKTSKSVKDVSCNPDYVKIDKKIVSSRSAPKIVNSQQGKIHKATPKTFVKKSNSKQSQEPLLQSLILNLVECQDNNYKKFSNRFFKKPNMSNLSKEVYKFNSPFSGNVYHLNPEIVSLENIGQKINTENINFLKPNSFYCEAAGDISKTMKNNQFLTSVCEAILFPSDEEKRKIEDAQNDFFKPENFNEENEITNANIKNVILEDSISELFAKSSTMSIKNCEKVLSQLSQQYIKEDDEENKSDVDVVSCVKEKPRRKSGIPIKIKKQQSQKVVTLKKGNHFISASGNCLPPYLLEKPIVTKTGLMSCPKSVFRHEIKPSVSKFKKSPNVISIESKTSNTQKVCKKPTTAVEQSLLNLKECKVEQQTERTQSAEKYDFLAPTEDLNVEICVVKKEDEIVKCKSNDQTPEAKVFKQKSFEQWHPYNACMKSSSHFMEVDIDHNMCDLSKPDVQPTDKPVPFTKFTDEVYSFCNKILHPSEKHSNLLRVSNSNFFRGNVSEIVKSLENRKPYSPFNSLAPRPIISALFGKKIQENLDLNSSKFSSMVDESSKTFSDNYVSFDRLMASGKDGRLFGDSDDERIYSKAFRRSYHSSNSDIPDKVMSAKDLINLN